MHSISPSNTIAFSKNMIVLQRIIEDTKLQRLFTVWFDYQEKILALMPPSNMRVDVGGVFAFQTAIRALELGLATTRGTQVRVKCAFVLVTLRTRRANVIPRFQSIHIMTHLDREGRIHKATSVQVTFQMTRG